MTEDRAERAFRDALHAEASRLPVEPLDPTAFTHRRRPARWPLLAAAASIVVVAAVALPAMLTGSPTTMTGAPAEVPAEFDTRAGDSAPESAPAPAGMGLPAPDPGMRWESYRDVAVQVPESWGYAVAPGTDWCADEASLPAEPYVDVDRGNRPVRAIACGERFPADGLVMHLSFSPAGGPEPWHPDSATFPVYRRELGSALVTVAARAADAALAERILASAVETRSDHNGCLVKRPDIIESTSWEGVPADALAGCLYDNATGWLVSSRTLGGPDATAVWEAVLAAPAGGGPDGNAEECRADDEGPVTVVLGWDGASAVFRFAGCTGNGIVDAGVEGGLRRVTPDLCRAVLQPPVTVFAGVGPAAELCLAASRIP